MHGPRQESVTQTEHGQESTCCMYTPWSTSGERYSDRARSRRIYLLYVHTMVHVRGALLRQSTVKKNLLAVCTHHGPRQESVTQTEHGQESTCCMYTPWSTSGERYSDSARARIYLLYVHTMVHVRGALLRQCTVKNLLAVYNGRAQLITPVTH
jgi:hypothetical protein